MALFGALGSRASFAQFPCPHREFAQKWRTCLLCAYESSGGLKMRLQGTVLDSLYPESLMKG